MTVLQQSRLVLRQWAEALLMHFSQWACWQKQILNSSAYWSRATSQLTSVFPVHATAFWGCSYLLLLHWRYRTLLPPAEKGQDLLDTPAKCPSVNLWMPAVSLESCCGSRIILTTYICVETINVQILSPCHSFPPNQCQSSLVWHWRWMCFLYGLEF